MSSSPLSASVFLLLILAVAEGRHGRHWGHGGQQGWGHGSHSGGHSWGHSGGHSWGHGSSEESTPSSSVDLMTDCGQTMTFAEGTLHEVAFGADVPSSGVTSHQCSLSVNVRQFTANSVSNAPSDLFNSFQMGSCTQATFHCSQFIVGPACPANSLSVEGEK